MQYKYLLDYIYNNFKMNKTLKSDQMIKFTSDNNTNINHFCIIRNDLDPINGTIICQNHQIIIYFNIKENDDDYLFVSKANIISIHKYNKAIINNCCLKNTNIEAFEKVIKNYDGANNLYKFSSSDHIVILLMMI